MQMERVESSNVKAIGYDAAAETMRVEFANGGAYDFSGVSAEKHADFLAADSKGKHFHKHIRGAHPSRKVA